MLIDTHCHLGDARFDADRAAVIRRAREAGVGQVIVVADSTAASIAARDLAATHALAATAGVHPHEAASWGDEARDTIAGLLDDARIVAVGETGLDYHYDHAPRTVQRAAFAAQLELAAARKMPVVVHARDADADTADLLREWGPAIPGVVLHSFSSGAVLLEAGLEIAAYFSFSGMVTFRNWNGDHAIREVPDARLLIETDAPYLAPHPYRGKRNEPGYVTYVAARVAAVRGVTPDVVARLTTANARRCFGERLAPLT